MAKKSKNAAAAAAEPPAKKSKNAPAAAAAGGGGTGAAYLALGAKAHKLGASVGVSKFAGRPGLLWRPATIVGIVDQKWPVVYEIKWGTDDEYGPCRLPTLALSNTVCVSQARHVQQYSTRIREC